MNDGFVPEGKKITTRKVDKQGRVVLPLKLRKHLGIEAHDALDYYIAEGKITLQKHIPVCVACYGTEDLRELNNKNFCVICYTKLKA